MIQKYQCILQYFCILKFLNGGIVISRILKIQWLCSMYDYDSSSDSSTEESIEDILLYGDFDEVDTFLRNGASLDILKSPRYDYFVKRFLRLRDWRVKIKNIQLLYIHHCTRQLENTDNPAVFLMELKCNIKSWVFIASMDEDLFIEHLEPYRTRFDPLAMQLCEDVLAFCRREPTHRIDMR